MDGDRQSATSLPSHRDGRLYLSDFPDHGSLEADIIAFLLTTRRTLRHRQARRIFPDLFAAVARGELTPISSLNWRSI